VVLEGGCRIGPGVVLPAGVVVTRNARLDCLDIAVDVRLPPGTRIDGDLRIAAGARIGRNVCLGKGVHIGPGAVLGDNAVVGAGAIIGSHACVAAGAVVGAAMHVGDGGQVRCEPPAADADFNTWQAYLSGNPVPTDLAQPQPGPGPQPQPQPLTPAMPPPSAPINIPAEVLRPLRGNAPLPRPYT
jgi:acetyltransferase-like isoleucine patch superfamily enzyme